MMIVGGLLVFAGIYFLRRNAASGSNQPSNDPVYSNPNLDGM